MVVGFLDRFKDIILVSLLAAMLGLAGCQILARNLFQSGFLWADNLVRVMVLWVGMIDAGVPEKLLNLMQAHVQSRTAFLMLLNIMLLAVGAILDIFSALVIMVPIILPVALNYGVDPVHLGIIFLANMQIGYMTPPVGMNLFIASYRFEKNVSDIYSAALPFMIVLLAALLVITYVPGLTLLFR